MGPGRKVCVPAVPAVMRSVDLDEDALTGALFGRFDDCFFHARGHVGETLGAAGIAEDLAALLDVREAVVEQREDVGRDLFAEAVAGAEVLVDPDLHGRVGSFGARFALTPLRVDGPK